MDLAPPIRFELRRGAVTAIPLAIAVGLFGVSFGVLSASTGGMGALLGSTPLPAPVQRVVALLAPALLAALVATAALGSGQELVLDARLFGLAAAAMGLALRAPVLLVVAVAAATAAIARLVGIG